MDMLFQPRKVDQVDANDEIGKIDSNEGNETEDAVHHCHEDLHE